MENIILKFKNVAYEMIFQEKISLGVHLFIKNVWNVFLGYGVAAFLIFLFEIINGKMLGPNEYGKYVLVASVAGFLYLLMLFGLNTAAVKFNSEKDDYQRQCRIVSSSYLIIIIFSLALSFLFYIFSPQLSHLFSVPTYIFRLSILFAFSLALYSLAVDMLRGLHKIRSLSIFRLCYGILIIILLIFSMVSGFKGFIATVSVICLSYILLFFLITISMRRYFIFQFDKSWISKFLRYGIYAVIGESCFIFLPGIIKIAVNKYLTTADLGVFNAYYFSSISVALFLYSTFIIVFFPAASKHQNKEMVFKKVERLSLFIVLAGLPFFLLTQTVVLLLMGKSYPINFYLIFLFATTSVAMAIFGIYSWLFCSEGVKGLRIMAAVSACIFLVNIFFAVYIIPHWLMYGAIISLGLAYSAGICGFLFFKNSLLNSNEKIDKKILWENQNF